MIKKMKLKLLIYEICSVLVMVLPLFILFITNKEHYLKNISPFGLSISGFLLVIFAILLVKDKFDVSAHKVFKFFTFFVFCYVFEPFLSDLKIISFMAFVGVGLNYIFFENRIKMLKIVIEKGLEKKYEQENDV